MASVLTACGGAQTPGCNGSDDPVYGGRRTGACFASSSPVDAVVTAGAAAAAWAVVGCTVNGCTPPYRCNTQTKLCEAIHCDENESCPPAYECDLIEHRCK